MLSFQLFLLSMLSFQLFMLSFQLFLDLLFLFLPFLPVSLFFFFHLSFFQIFKSLRCIKCMQTFDKIHLHWLHVSIIPSIDHQFILGDFSLTLTLLVSLVLFLFASLSLCPSRSPCLSFCFLLSN